MVENVIVDGIQATQVIDISYADSYDGGIGKATVTVANTDANRTLFQPGSTVELVRQSDGETVWSGEVNGKPSNTSKRNLKLDVEVEAKSGALEYINVDRPFIEMTNAEVLRESVEKERDPEVTTEFVHKGSSVSGWSSNGVDLELSNTPTELHKFGFDVIYVGVETNTEDPVFAEYDFDPSLIPERRFFRLDSRIIVNNQGGVFDLRISITDEGGIRYEWEPDTTGVSEFDLYELPVEDATVTTGHTPGKLRYEVIPNGTVPENRAFAIDHAKAVRFRLLDRDVGVTTDIEDTSFTTTRRLSASVLELVDRFATEDGYTGFVTETNTLEYKPSGAVRAPFDIDENGTEVDVVDISVNRDYDVRNRVTVQGKGDIQVSFEDTASIQFYNAEVPKQEPIDNPDLITEEQAKRRARGYLNDNAWEDSAITVTVADPRADDVKPGMLMGITYPSEGVDGDFVVGGVSKNASRTTEISLSGTTSI